MYKVVPRSLRPAARLGQSCFWLAATLILAAKPARAQQQVVIVDAMYTATAQNTMDSHYRVTPLIGTPSNWRAPVDYASGTAYVRLEVLTKPSTQKTLYNVCFEGTQAACMGYPPPYTAPGTYDFSFAFNTFWQYNVVDWNKGIKNVALILKDEAGNKVQGDPKFYPTTIHVVITLVPPGGKYVPPMPKDAGATLDAGKTDAGPAADAAPPLDADAGMQMDSAEPPADARAMDPVNAGTDAVVADAGSVPVAAGAGGAGSGSMLSSRRDAGMIMLHGADATPELPVHAASGSCSVRPAWRPAAGAWLWLLASVPVLRRFRRRLAPH